MIIETHVIQSLQPNNLNRDDTGAPKVAIFGGVTRRRVSSQSLKRAQREYLREHNLLAPDALGVRTKRLVEQIENKLRKEGKPEDQAAAVARAAVLALGFGVDDKHKTEYLLFVSGAEIEHAAAQALLHFDELAAVAETLKSKDDAKKLLPVETHNAFQHVLGSGNAVDVALFGRMLADLPDRNIEAASHVAHAISTHAVDEEWDYYTAVDDFKPDDTSGADMIGSIGYSSCCLYRYQAVDASRLASNLDGNTELATRSVAALLQAIVHALPSGKQTTLASPNPPSTVLTVVRKHGGESLANAFLNPVRASDLTDGLEQLSLDRLTDYWSRLRRMYGEDGIVSVKIATLYPERLDDKPLAEHQIPTLSGLIQYTVASIS